MPWFLWIFVLIGVCGVVMAYIGEKKNKRDWEFWLWPAICGPIVFSIIAGVGYIEMHNKFIFTYNGVQADKKVIVILREQEEDVITLVNIEAHKFLKHEERVLKELKIDRENLSAVLIAYPQLRSSEVIVKYLNDIRQLRQQITVARGELFGRMAKYNSYAEAAFNKHFRPKHLPLRLE